MSPRAMISKHPKEWVKTFELASTRERCLLVKWIKYFSCCLAETHSVLESDKSHSHYSLSICCCLHFKSSNGNCREFIYSSMSKGSEFGARVNRKFNFPLIIDVFMRSTPNALKVVNLFSRSLRLVTNIANNIMGGCAAREFIIKTISK